MLPRAALELRSALAMTRAGVFGLQSPAELRRIVRTVSTLGPLGGALGLAAVRHGDRIGLVDEVGALTFRELDARSDALAVAWRSLGLGEGSRIGILCRNHRWLLDSTFAAAKIGARMVFLNTDYAGPQLLAVCAREGVEALVHDAEFAEAASGLTPRFGRFTAWPEGDVPEIQALIDRHRGSAPRPPGRPGTVVMMTSGTTGTPRGAVRPTPMTLAAGMVYSKIPLRGDGGLLVAPPMHHGWGLFMAGLGIGVGAKLVLRRRYDAAGVLDDLVRHRCHGLLLVPVMLRRLLDLGEEIGGHDLSRLRIIATGGAPLGAPLAARAMQAFGPVLYNSYGSTECAIATVATPADLRKAPGCVGRPLFGTRVEVVDRHGAQAPPGTSGRIFIGSSLQVSAYTSGDQPPRVRGLIETGDVGHFDGDGRLFVDGRNDEMIVSGGENVYPQEVEDLLAAHPGIADAAVLGVPDEEFGQTLRAFVVPRGGVALTEDQIRGHVRENLARFKVPRSVVFLDELPRNLTGKLLKRHLAETGHVRGL